ncbi:hypothetical protein [Larkinella harenae]
MNRTMGGVLQLAADTSNDVKEIRAHQKTAERALANVEFKIDDLSKDVSNLKSDHSAAVARIAAIEKKDTERTSFFKGSIMTWSFIFSGIMALVLNFNTIIEFYKFVIGKEEKRYEQSISPPDP